MPSSVRQQYETFKAELMQNPAIVGVTASNSRLGSFLSETGIRFEGRDPDENWNVPYNGVDYDFIPFYGLELVEGRNFSREIASDTARAVHHQSGDDAKTGLDLGCWKTLCPWLRQRTRRRRGCREGLSLLLASSQD